MFLAMTVMWGDRPRSLGHCPYSTHKERQFSPVGKIVDHGKEINYAGFGPTIQKLYDTLTGIQMGRIEAPEGWIQVIE